LMLAMALVMRERERERERETSANAARPKKINGLQRSKHMTETR
jgi:hypothetical protein